MVDLRLVIPDDFYEEEVQDGYVVTKEMKKVWAVELDLLKKLLEVCEKHNIHIVACGGTVLGAVRHKGFIPWDDDIDMMMLREEYDKLCKIAQEEFKYPYFFQTEYTDPGSLRRHAQLRNSETTAILAKEKGKVKFNQGIFIDIFPLDNVTNHLWKFKIQKNIADFYRRLYGFVYNNSYMYKQEEISTEQKIKSVIAKSIDKVFSYQKIYKKFEETCAYFNNENTEYVSQLFFEFDNKVRYRKKEYLQDIIEMEFEMLKIPVCREYEKMLDSRYGKWRTFVTGSSNHGQVIFDTNINYKVFLNEN